MYCRQSLEKLLKPDASLKPFSFAYNGQPCDLSSITPVIESVNGITEQITYEAVPGIIKITLSVTRWQDYPVIEYTPYFENISEKASGILSDISALDYETDDLQYFGKQELKDIIATGNSRLTVRYHLGSKAAGTDFLPQRRDIFSRPGCNKLELECTGAWCSTDFLPFFAIDHDPMNGINLAIGWSGGWKCTVEKEIEMPVLAYGTKSRIRCGMRRASFRLNPGEKVMQPGVLIHFREGKSIRDGQNEFRRFMIAHKSPRNSRGELLKPPISFAVWGGLETDQQIKRIAVIKDKKLPYENFWIDAGWMGSAAPCPHYLEPGEKRSNWYTRVGSWKFNIYAHPQGLRPIADAVHQANMRLLVWFETLRINAFSGSKLICEHPDWLLGDLASAKQEGSKINLVLNLGVPEARQYILDMVCGIIDREKIDDYREDFNIDPAAQLYMNEAEDRTGITEMKFVEGFYLFWEELRKRYPDMYIDNCAGGGRRLDYKSASLSFPLCQSDFGCYLPHEVECVQFENNYLDEWLPLHGTLNWGPEDPYHAASGLGGGYASKIWQFNGREPHANHDFEMHRKILIWGKALRDIHLTGDIYPLVESPEDDFAKWNGQQIHDPERNCGMVQIFRRQHSPEADFQLALTGLLPEARYQVDFFTGESKIMTGKELSVMVITLPSPRSFQIISYKIGKKQ